MTRYQGVARMNFISSTDAGHNVWDTAPNAVHPSFYGELKVD